MPTAELLFLTILRALVEVALLTLLGQGVLALLAGSKREANPIYQLFAVVTRPVIRAVRFLTPRFVIDRHIPFVAFFLLLWAWLFLAYLKLRL